MTVLFARPKANWQLFYAYSLRFPSEEELMARLGVIKGSVTPFAIINDTEHVVQGWWCEREVQVSLLITPVTLSQWYWNTAYASMSFCASSGWPYTSHFRLISLNSCNPSPLENNATTQISPEDLDRFFSACGASVSFFQSKQKEQGEDDVAAPSEPGT